MTTRRAFLATLVAAPVAVAVAPQVVYPVAKLAFRADAFMPLETWTPAHMNWYRSQMVESMGMGSLMRSPDVTGAALVEKWRS